MPDIFNKILKKKKNRGFKVVEIVNQNTGSVFQELVPLEIAHEMTVTGLKEHETRHKNTHCELEPIYDKKGEIVGEQDICRNLSQSGGPKKDSNCELVPIIDAESGKVIDVKQVCKEDSSNYGGGHYD